MGFVPVDTAEIALWIYRESKNHLLIEPAVASIFLLISKKINPPAGNAVGLMMTFL